MKPSWEKLIQLAGSCSRSANLEMDFDDPGRLSDIYVSSKFQTGLGEILASVLDAGSNGRVRVLSGSPGLGKSTFALFASQAVSKNHPKLIRGKLERSGKALREQFETFQKSKKSRLLPVFVNGYEGDIEEAFIKNLRRALLRQGLPAGRQNQKSALKFYRESIRLLKKRGYGGVFAVYDEFGKYLERAVYSPAGLDLQFLQNFAEFCGRSGENQCHLTLITHLSISQYARRLPLNIQREWAKVEGRFQEFAFYGRSFDHYKMISAAFKKNIAQTAPALAKKRMSYIKKHISGFRADALDGFMRSEGAEKIFLNCYPLHPIVLSLLPYLSAKTAQNERTLFAFLTRDESGSLKRFLNERFQDGGALVMPYDLYQYFSPLIGRDTGIGGSYKIQLMAEEAFAKINKKDEASKQIISLMAVCSVIKNPHFAPLTEEFLSSCLNQEFPRGEIKKSLKFLRDEQILFYNKRARQYLLREGSPVDIEGEMARLKSKSLTGKKLVQILKRHFEPGFIAPKKYNFDHAITRFFRTEIVSVEELKKVRKSGKVNFYKEDGRLFYVVPFSHDEWAYAKREIQKIQHPLAVFVLPKRFIECKKDIEELNALDRLSGNKEILSAGPLAKKELDRRRDVLLAGLRSLLKPFIGCMGLSAEAVYPGESLRAGKPALFHDISSFKGLQRFLGELFERAYSKHIKFNLEYMNRRSVSGSVTLGRKKFIDLLTARRLCPEKTIESLMEGRGPDYAIFKAMKKLSGFKFNKGENIYKISPGSDFFRFFVEYKKILSAHPRGLKGSRLLDMLTAPPCGLRLGVVPVFAALADLSLRQPVSHYFDSAYVKDPGGDHYDLMMKYPAKTVIHYTPIDGGRQDFLDGLGKIFGAGGGSIRLVLEAILKWRKSVPESTKQAAGLSSGGRRLLIQIDSSREPDRLLFKKFPECFRRPAVSGRSSADQISGTLSLVRQTKKEIDGAYRNLLLQISGGLADFIGFVEKDCLNIKKRASRKTAPAQNLPQDFQAALAKVKRLPFSAGTRRFIGRALNFDASSHHQYFFETMADVLTGASPRHWDSSGCSKFKFALKKIKTEIELACEIAHPSFKGQSVLAFIDRGSDRRAFLRLGAFPGKGSRLLRAAEGIKAALDSFDEADKRKIILAVLESFESQPLAEGAHFEDPPL